MNPQDLPPELIQMLMAQQQMGPSMGGPPGMPPQPGQVMGGGAPPQMLAQQLMQPRPFNPSASPAPQNQMTPYDFY